MTDALPHGGVLVDRRLEADQAAAVGSGGLPWLVGPTKDGDVPASVRMAAYAAVLEYFPAARVLLAALDRVELGIVALGFDNAFGAGAVWPWPPPRPAPTPRRPCRPLRHPGPGHASGGQLPPPEFSRPEVATLLTTAAAHPRP